MFEDRLAKKVRSDSLGPVDYALMITDSVYEISRANEVSRGSIKVFTAGQYVLNFFIRETFPYMYT